MVRPIRGDVKRCANSGRTRRRDEWLATRLPRSGRTATWQLDEDGEAPAHSKEKKRKPTKSSYLCVQGTTISLAGGILEKSQENKLVRTSKRGSQSTTNKEKDPRRCRMRNENGCRKNEADPVPPQAHGQHDAGYPLWTQNPWRGPQENFDREPNKGEEEKRSGKRGCFDKARGVSAEMKSQEGKFPSPLHQLRSFAGKLAFQTRQGTLTGKGREANLDSGGTLSREIKWGKYVLG